MASKLPSDCPGDLLQAGIFSCHFWLWASHPVKHCGCTGKSERRGGGKKKQKKEKSDVRQNQAVGNAQWWAGADNRREWLYKSMCVCTGFGFSRPPALHLMFFSPLPDFFFLSFFVPNVSLAFLLPVAFLCYEALAGTSWLMVSCFFGQEQKSFVWGKKKRWDYLSQHYLPIIFTCWCLSARAPPAC